MFPRKIQNKNKRVSTQTNHLGELGNNKQTEVLNFLTVKQLMCQTHNQFTKKKKKSNL